MCRRRVDRLIVSGCCVWSTDPDCMSLSKLCDFIFLSRCQRFLFSNSGAAGIDYWSHTHTHQKKCIHVYIVFIFFFLFLCAYFFFYHKTKQKKYLPHLDVVVVWLLPTLPPMYMQKKTLKELKERPIHV